MMELSLCGFLFKEGYGSRSVRFVRFCAIALEAGWSGG